MIQTYTNIKNSYINGRSGIRTHEGFLPADLKTATLGLSVILPVSYGTGIYINGRSGIRTHEGFLPAVLKTATLGLSVILPVSYGTGIYTSLSLFSCLRRVSYI